jgi:hypothetical protein
MMIPVYSKALRKKEIKMLKRRTTSTGLSPPHSPLTRPSPLKEPREARRLENLS